MVINPKIIVPVVLGVSLCTATAVLFYLIFKKESNEVQSSKRKKTPMESIELKIPAQLAPAIIGRGGLAIKELELSSGAQIVFKDDPSKDKEADRLCIIRGSAETVAIAEGMIKTIVAKHASLEEKIITVPIWAIGRIIGRGGENIREICHISGAKVNVDSQVNNASRAAHKKITIKGSPDEIKVAIDIINKSVEQEKNRRETDLSRREPRGRHGAVAGDSVENTNPQPTTDAGNDGALLEVFVSAVSSPSRFWLQIIGPQVEQLDKLVDMMSEYYSNADNREANKLDNIQVGQIVAAVFRHDGKWYRAKVVEIKQNEFDGRQQVCDVYFVDYGDNEYVAKSELLALRTDMLQLRFQAVECFLAGVAPAPDDEQVADRHHWNPRAIERFEELTQVCRWKRLWSRTCAFKEKQSTESEIDTAIRDTRESSPIPGVKLYDTKDGKDINVGQVLVEEGWAMEIEESALEEKKNISVSPSTPAPHLPPPSFGDLECSRVLGMVIGGREERAASLPHGGLSPRASPQPSSPADEDAIFSSLSGDSKPKSTSLAAGMDHEKPHKTIPDFVSSETNDSPQMNGSARTSNGSLKHQNGDFLNAERIKSVPMIPKELCSLPKDSGPKGREPLPKPLVHIVDSKEDLRAKINRVDSHHGNLESLEKHDPPPSDAVAPIKVHKDQHVDES